MEDWLLDTVKITVYSFGSTGMVFGAVVSLDENGGKFILRDYVKRSIAHSARFTAAGGACLLVGYGYMKLAEKILE